MARGPADIPLTKDATGRFLPWIIALMVFLATLALATAMMLADLAARWDRGLDGAVIVQVAPLSAAGAAPVEVRVASALGVLAALPGVIDARAVPMDEASRLVEPWLGSGAATADLPLPALIDVRVAPGADIAQMRSQLEGHVPGLSVEEPGAWLADLKTLARSVRWVSLAIVLLIGAAAVGAVIFAANAGLASHRPVVELLHVMGATDVHVARQFQRQMTRLALFGGVAGFAVAAATLWGLTHLAAQLDAAMLPSLALSGLQWAALTAVPILAALLAATASRLTVLRTLERLP